MGAGLPVEGEGGVMDLIVMMIFRRENLYSIVALADGSSRRAVALAFEEG